MNRRINPRIPAEFALSSLDPAEAQWLESVSRALIRHIAFLKQLKQLNPLPVAAPNQDTTDLPAASGATLVGERHCRRKQTPCLVTIPRHWTVSLLAILGGSRA